MTLRYIKATFIPRAKFPNSRGEKQWGADRANARDIRMGLTVDRVNRAEVRGNVEIEVYRARLPYTLEGVGPGAVIIWDGSEWDVSAPEQKRMTRTHSVRHVTVEIRRRPYSGGGRD